MVAVRHLIDVLRALGAAHRYRLPTVKEMGAGARKLAGPYSSGGDLF
jgi:hypothetical protein